MKKRFIYILCGVVLLLGAGFFGVKAMLASYTPEASVSEGFAPETVQPTETPALETPKPAATETPAPTETPVPYESPIDFEKLQAVNPDIYAWLEIENTNISYPIVQSATDDMFYLDHNSDKAYSANGAIFSESQYNRGDMTDPVMILYGHHMKSGAMFGDLQQYYSDGKFFEENKTITVYTPEACLEYGVFAAMPFSSDHILYYHDFTDEHEFETFFGSVFNARDLSAHFNDEFAPKAGDKVLILSTCLAGDNSRRFLVMATLLA